MFHDIFHNHYKTQKHAHKKDEAEKHVVDLDGKHLNRELTTGERPVNVQDIGRTSLVKEKPLTVYEIDDQ